MLKVGVWGAGNRAYKAIEQAGRRSADKSGDGEVAVMLL